MGAYVCVCVLPLDGEASRVYYSRTASGTGSGSTCTCMSKRELNMKILIL